MKILVSVCGIGLGHSTRVFSILEKLKKKVEVSVVASNISYKYLKARGYKPRNILDINISGEEFTVDTIDSIIDNLDFPVQFIKNYSVFSEIVNDFRPDVILCDTEPSSFLVSRLRKIKLVSLTNYLSSLYELRRLPRRFLKKDVKTQMHVMRGVTDATVKYSDLTFNISLKPRKSQNRKVVDIGLVLREQPGELAAEDYIKSKITHDEFYLVSFGGSPLGTTLFEPLLRSLKKFRDKRFIISSSQSVSKVQNIGNITVMPFIDNYLEYLKICKGVISLAGFSTISETLAFRKPSLVIPIRNHLEQLLNAQMLKRLKLSETCLIDKDFSVVSRALKSFFSREDEIRKRVEKFKLRTDGAEQAAKIILSMK